MTCTGASLLSSLSLALTQSILPLGSSFYVINTTQIDLVRNRVSLGIRCRWGIRNALFFVAKEAGSDKVLGTAMWLPPRPLNKKLTWGEWAWEKLEEWRLWGNQVGMNLWYGRGGLNVKVCFTFAKKLFGKKYSAARKLI